MKNLLLLLNGIDEEKLKDAPKHERVVYNALGGLMILASLWTGIGMTIKISNGFELNFISSFFIFIFISLFALLLETVVVGTLKKDFKFLGSVGLRLLIGLNLIMLQVLPLLVMIFSSQIELFKHQKMNETLEQEHQKIVKINDIDYLKKQQIYLDNELKEARNQAISPPINHKVEEIKKFLTSEEPIINNLKEQITKEQDSLKKNNQQKSYLQNQIKFLNSELINNNFDTNKEKQDKIKNDLKINQQSLLNLDKKIKNLEEIIQQLEQEHSIKEDNFNKKTEEKLHLIKKQDEMIKFNLLDTEKKFTENNLKLTQSETKVSQEQTKTKELIENSNQSKFFNDIISLFEIAQKNFNTAIMIGFIFLFAFLIDMMPILTKIQLNKGVYAKITQNEEEIIKTESDVIKNQKMNIFEQQKLETEKSNLELEKTRIALFEEQNNIRLKMIETQKKVKELEKMLHEKPNDTTSLILLKLKNEWNKLNLRKNKINEMLIESK